MKKMVVEMKEVQHENEVLRQEASNSVKNEHTKGGEHSARKRMAKKIGGSSTIEQLLHRINLLYSDGIMLVSLLPRFKVL